MARWSVTAVVFAAIFATAGFFEWTDWQRRLEEHHAHQQALLSRIDARLSAELHAAIGALLGYGDWVALHPDISDAELDRYAQRLLTRHPLLRSTTLLPGDRIRHTFPSNPAMIGLDVGHHPDQGAAVRTMIQSGQPVVTGPMHLLDGGDALVLRAPVWIDSDAPRYFGHVAVLVDLARVRWTLEQSGDELGMHIALVDDDQHGTTAKLLLGPRLRTGDDVVSARIDILGERWQLRGRVTTAPTFPPSLARLALELLFALLAALGARLLAVTTQRMRAQNRMLKELATTDPLTGIANRRVLMETGETSFALARRTDTALSALMLDLDRFKLVNDTHGHRAGDQVLCHVARLLKETLRTTDVLGRWGGEEFLILAPGTGVEGAQQLAERILNAIRHAPAITLVGPLSITASIGIATLVRSDTAPHALYERADKGLYMAKAQGRDRAVVFQGTPPPEPTTNTDGESGSKVIPMRREQS